MQGTGQAQQERFLPHHTTRCLAPEPTAAWGVAEPVRHQADMRDHPRGRRLILRAVIALWGLVLLGGVLGAPSAQAQSFAAYITNADDDTVSVITTATNTVEDTVPVGDGPRGVAVTPDGARVYVANALSGTVSVIATATNTVEDTVPVGDAPGGVAVTPDGARVYVANALSGTVSVIATATNAVEATVAVGTVPRGSR